MALSVFAVIWPLGLISTFVPVLPSTLNVLLGLAVLWRLAT